LRAELRTKEAVNASLSFAMVVLLLFSFAFDPDEETMRAMSGGLLWIVFAFAGTLLLNRSFARELPNDCLDALISAPIPGPALLAAMVLSSELIAGKPITSANETWLKLLVGFDVMYTAVSLALVEVVLVG